MPLLSYLTAFLDDCKTIIIRFNDNDGFNRAGALSFFSVLALVPLLFVSLALVSRLPGFEHILTPVQNFIFENFVPSTGKIVQTHLQTFVTQAKQISTLGVSFLVFTAVFMMINMEIALNTTWHVKHLSYGWFAFIIYWLWLMLIPFIVGMVVVIGSYFLTIPFISKKLANFSVILSWLPSLFILCVFFVLYYLMPNAKVAARDALIGSFIVTCLFSASKLGFVFYFSQFHTYELVYGTMATIPLFFFWIYCVWCLVLLGAEITYLCGVKRSAL